MKPSSPLVESTLARMSLEQKVGQCVVVGMSGTVISNDLREAILRFQCGGIRLSPFTRNFRYFSDQKAKKQELGPDYAPSLQKIARAGHPPYRTPEQYAALLNELREMAARRSPAVPLHMVVDQEGDTSKDVSRGGMVQFPSALGLAAAGDPELTRQAARCIARQLKASGFDMIHSPVVDVNLNPGNPEIGVRAFGDDPEQVAEQALAMLKGFQEEGLIAAAKHFPGRGDSAIDAHHACPVLEADLERIQRVELYPFKRLIEAGVEAIIVAHGLYPALDTEIATVSRRILTGLLREQLGFQGLITTDSMTMGALIDRYGIGESCARALQAGADVVLMKAENQWRGEMFYTIRKWVEEGRILPQELEDKVRRILSLKEKYGLFVTMGKVEPFRASHPYRDPHILNTARRAARRAVLVPKDKLGAIPLDPGKRILLVNQLNTIKSPNDAWDHPGLFSELLEAELPGLQTYETEFEYDPGEEERLLAFLDKNAFDLILCTNYYDRAAKPHTYPKTLIERGFPVLLITNTPYCIGGLGGMIPQAPGILLNMNLTPEGFRTAREVLFGRAVPEGRWPLANYDPFGLAGSGR